MGYFEKMAANIKKNYLCEAKNCLA